MLRVMCSVRLNPSWYPDDNEGLQKTELIN